MINFLILLFSIIYIIGGFRDGVREVWVFFILDKKKEEMIEERKVSRVYKLKFFFFRLV